MATRHTGKPAGKRVSKLAPKPSSRTLSRKTLRSISASASPPAHHRIDLRRIYNRKNVKEIADECGVIPPELHEQLKSFLIDAAEKYLDVPHVQSRAERLTAMRDKFERIAAAGHELLTVLNELTDDDDRWHLWAPMWDDPMLPSFIYEDTNIAGYPSEYSAETSFLSALSEFQTRIESMKARLAHVRNVGGRPTKDALAHWAVVARDFFEYKLNADFNYYERYGVRKCAAFKFMKAAIRRIDGDVTDANIATAIRNACKDSVSASKPRDEVEGATETQFEIIGVSVTRD